MDFEENLYLCAISVEIEVKICFNKAYKQIFPCFFYYPLLKGCYEEMLAENRDTIGLL
jgi:hypothetical protein